MVESRCVNRLESLFLEFEGLIGEINKDRHLLDKS